MILISLFNLKKNYKIYGLGLFIKKKIKCILGLKNHNTFNNIIIINLMNSVYLDSMNYKLNYKLNENLKKQVLIKNLKLDYLLKLEIYENIIKQISIGTYKGFCHKNNLPVKGQRTKTNRFTQRFLSLERLKKPKKLF
jgi:small subunit ribosomal protein S13